MGVAARAWISVAIVFAWSAPVRAQSYDGHTHLIPLPHPEILHPNEPSLPPRVLHPHVFRARPHHLPRHQHLIPVPHPELLHPRPAPSFGSGLIMMATLRTDGSQSPPAPADHDALVNAPRDVPGHLIPCWHPPPLGNDTTHQITVRMEFARDGSIIGRPLVTYVEPGTGTDARKDIIDSIQTGLRQCTPLHFAPQLGNGIAGYPFVIRFVLAHDDATPQY